MTDKTLQKYLERYIEPEALQLHNFPSKTFSNSLVIPAYRESTDFLQRLCLRPPGDNFLLILVSNHPGDLDTDTQRQAIEYHQEIENFLTQKFNRENWQTDHLSLYSHPTLSVLMVERTAANALPTEQGVGKARKIGCDIALALHHQGIINSPWIMNTDADAHLPADYFNAAQEITGSALIYPFHHRADNRLIGQATRLYEKRINHYVYGLRKAGSNYAFHTIGSLIAINVDAYIAVRGVPKRAAAEDFYLLNKLAKVGPVHSLGNPVIKLDCRISDRVPFGTGPAVAKLQGSTDLNAEAIFYHPEIFNQLQALLACLQKSTPALVQQQLEALSQRSVKVLKQLDIDQALTHAERQKLAQVQLQRHLEGWFDGFRTLKYVHLMRDQYFPSLSLYQLEQQGLKPFSDENP